MRLVCVVTLTATLLLGFLWVRIEDTARSPHARSEERLREPSAVGSDPGTDRKLLSSSSRVGSRSHEREPLPIVACLPIRGRVIDREGNGIAHLSVKLEPEQAPPRWSEYGDTLLKTDVRGEFRFPAVPEGVYSVVAVIKIWGRDLAYTRTNVKTGTTDVTITIAETLLPLPLVLRIKALHPSGHLLEAARMRLCGSPDRSWRAIRDGYGEIRIRSRPPPGQTHVRLRIEPPENLAGAVVTYAYIDLRVQDHEIRLDEPRVLTGRVLANGEPCAVQVDADEWDWTPGRYTTRSSADGRFRFEKLPKGKVSLSVNEKGFGMLDGVVVPTDAKEVVIHVARPVRVTGRVLAPFGTELGVVKLHLSVSSGHGVRSAGAWEYVGSTFDLGLRAPGSDCALLISGTLSDGSRFVPSILQFKPDRDPLVVRLEAGREVSGRVVLANGSPVAKAWVSILHGQALKWNLFHPGYGDNTETKKDGTFRLTGIDDSGWYVTAWMPFHVQVGPPLPVQGGEDLRIVLAPPKEIRGRVVDESGKSLYGITIDHWHPDPDAPRWGSLPGRPVGGDGAFTLEGLAPGRHVLYAWSDGGDDWGTEYSQDHRYALASVEAGATNVRLTLGKGKTVEGQVTLADGEPGFAEVRIDGRWGTRRRWTREGRFSFKGVPPGSCTIAARQGLWVAHRVISDELRIEAGGPPVTLVMREPR